MPIDNLEKFKNIRHDTSYSPEPEFDDKMLGNLPQILLQRYVVEKAIYSAAFPAARTFTFKKKLL